MIGIIVPAEVETEFRARNYYPQTHPGVEPIPHIPPGIEPFPHVPTEIEPYPHIPPGIEPFPEIPSHHEPYIIPDLPSEEVASELFFWITSLAMLLVKDKWMVESYY